MRHSLRAHISYLETTIRSVRDRLKKRNLSFDEVQDLELQLTLAQSALEHYRQAYALELSVAGADPPDGADAQSEDGTGNAEKPESERKKPGLALVARSRTRKKKRGGSLYPFPVSGGRKCA